MDRRGFLKTLLASAVMGAAISTGLGRAEAIKLVSGNLDPVKVKNMGQVWAINSQFGGYMYSDQLSDEIRKALKPAIKFRQFASLKRGLQA